MNSPVRSAFSDKGSARAGVAMAALVCCLGLALTSAQGQTTKPASPATVGAAKAAAIYDEVTTSFTGAQVGKWETANVDGKDCLVSPIMDFGAGNEVNHHRVVGVFTGDGTIEVSVAHSSVPNRTVALSKRHLHNRFQTLKNKRVLRFTSGKSRERYAWLLVRITGQVDIKGVGYSCWRGKSTIYGHVPRHFDFASSKLLYRLMYPRDYDPTRKYPLVVSVSGSGGVGMDNVKNMERVTFASHLFTRYYHDKDVECFSIVPQIPPPAGQIPSPYYPKGPRGAPDPVYHPDWPAVNENGWYTQATLALVQSLIKDESISVDPDRVYFAGFSYGGKACWEFLRAGRDVFAAGASGGGWPIGRAGRAPDAAMLKRLKLEVSRHKHVPVYIFVGQNDAMRFGSTAIHNEIIAQGGKSHYDEIPRASHVSAAGRGWGNRKMILWLFQQRRSKNPKPGADPFPGGRYVSP